MSARAVGTGTVRDSHVLQRSTICLLTGNIREGGNDDLFTLIETGDCRVDQIVGSHDTFAWWLVQRGSGNGAVACGRGVG
jgi:hypothetical protein